MDEIKTYDGELGELVQSRVALMQMLLAIERGGWFADLDAQTECGTPKEKCPRATRAALCGQELRTAIQAVEARIRALDPKCELLPENDTFHIAHRRCNDRSQ